MDPLITSFRDFVEASPRTRGARFVVAVSGGVDSMALLDAARRVLSPDRLIVAHYHHGVRASADRDEALVHETASRWGLRYATERRLSGRDSEAAMRDDRRAFLKRVKAQNQADFILLAHHADDQLETFVMRLLRGAGLDGLSAMAPRSGIWLRPWLSVSRASIESFAQTHGVACHHDETNFSERYLRGRVRKLLPAIYELATPFGGRDAFLRRMSASLGEIREAGSFLRQEAKARGLDSLVVTAWWARVPRTDLTALSPLLRKRAVRRILRQIGSPVPSRDSLETLSNFLRAGQGRIQIEGVEAEVSCGYVFFRSQAQRTLSTPSGQTLLSALGLELDYDATTLELRFPRPGDRVRSTKLKKIWLENGVPRPERALMPVIVRRGSHEVVWFPGLSSDHVTLRGCSFPFARRLS